MFYNYKILKYIESKYCSYTRVQRGLIVKTSRKSYINCSKKNNNIVKASHFNKTFNITLLNMVCLKI